MSALIHCPVCGGELPSDAPQGLCPRCLLQQGLSRNCDKPALSVNIAPAKSRNGHQQADERSVKERESSRFELLGEIARGGMGAILRGRDPNLGRDLAVKVLLEKHCDQPGMVSRFIEEAKINGQLEHPGIVPVHELGTFADNRPYFTMKLVEGQTLAALLAARRDCADDQPRLLRIFEQVCQTVAYAHSRSVIHRDLKPSNVMVGNFGEVQVMDWGLAKMLEWGAPHIPADSRTTETPQPQTLRGSSDRDTSRFGSVFGTPAYMPPEQARGAVDWLDARADVFSLGAILCEILTGEPPNACSNVGGTEHPALPPDSSAAWERLASCEAEPELVSLARRCLAPLPQARPRDAGVLAHELAAYMQGVQDRLKQADVSRAQAQAVAAEEVKRRRLAVASAAVILVLAAGAAGLGVWLVSDRQRRAERLERSGRELDHLKEQAELAADDLSGWAAASEAALRAQQLLDDAPNTLARAGIARQIASVRERAAGVNRDRNLLAQLAEIREGIDELPYSETEAAYTAAFKAAGMRVDEGSFTHEAIALAHRSVRVTAALAAELDHWAALRRKRGDCDRAARLTVLARLADPDEWRGRLRAAFTQCRNLERSAALGSLAASARGADLPPLTLASLAAALLDAGNPTEAEAVLRPAVLRSPDNIELNLLLARTLEKRLRHGEAIRYYMAARALRPESAHPLAHILQRQGETEEAIGVLRELTRLRPTHARHLGCLAQALRARGRSEEADAALDKAIAAGKQAIQLHPDDAASHGFLGKALRDRGRSDEAIAEYRQALSLDPDNVSGHLNLGLAFNQRGLPDEAVAEFHAAIRVRPDDANAFLSLADVLLDAKHDLEGGTAALHRALELDPGNALAHYRLGEVLGRAGRIDEALGEYLEAIRLKPDFAEAHCNFGLILCDYKHDSGGAILAFREAIRLKPDLAFAHYNLANAMQNEGPRDEVIAEYREAIRLKPDLAEAHCNLGMQLRLQGRFAEALTELELGHKIGSQRAHWHYPSGVWVEELRKQMEMESKPCGAPKLDDSPARPPGPDR